MAFKARNQLGKWETGNWKIFIIVLYIYVLIIMTNDFYSLYQDCGSEGSLQTPPGISGAVSPQDSSSNHPWWLWRWAGQPKCCREEVGRPSRQGAIAVVVSRWKCVDCCHPAPAPTTCRQPATTRAMAATAWVVAGWCAGGANAIVNSDTYLCSRIKTHGAWSQAELQHCFA